MNELLPRLDPCSIAIKCADDPRLSRCLDSIDDPGVSINAVITPSKETEAILNERGVRYDVTSYGNIARSAQISVDQAEHDTVIVMDSDAYFAPGAILKLRQAVQGAIVAKPRLDFQHTNGRISKILADSRSSFNSRPDFATNPGLTLKRRELAERCGYVFNPKVRWTEDADLNYRMQQAGVGLVYVPDAVVVHDPVRLGHELSCAFRYGIGKRLSVEATPGRQSSEELASLLKNLRANFHFEGLQSDKSLGSLALGALWRTLYLGGYHSQKHLGLWTEQA